MTKERTYKEAFQRIEQIVSEIEGDDPDVDKLTDLVREGLELLKYCKNQLRSIEDDLKSAFGELD
jgi:exodeoxyribonuclease VII small subunit